MPLTVKLDGTEIRKPENIELVKLIYQLHDAKWRARLVYVVGSFVYIKYHRLGKLDKDGFARMRKEDVDEIISDSDIMMFGSMDGKEEIRNVLKFMVGLRAG